MHRKYGENIKLTITLSQKKVIRLKTNYRKHIYFKVEADNNVVQKLYYRNHKT